jgi:hypothetical protein
MTSSMAAAFKATVLHLRPMRMLMLLVSLAPRGCYHRHSLAHVAQLAVRLQ